MSLHGGGCIPAVDRDFSAATDEKPLRCRCKQPWAALAPDDYPLLVPGWVPEHRYPWTSTQGESPIPVPLSCSFDTNGPSIPHPFGLRNTDGNQSRQPSDGAAEGRGASRFDLVKSRSVRLTSCQGGV